MRETQLYDNDTRLMHGNPDPLDSDAMNLSSLYSIKKVGFMHGNPDPLDSDTRNLSSLYSNKKKVGLELVYSLGRMLL